MKEVINRVLEVELMHMCDIPRVDEFLAFQGLELVSVRLNHSCDDERPLPWWQKFVSIIVS